MQRRQFQTSGLAALILLATPRGPAPLPPSRKTEVQTDGKFSLGKPSCKGAGPPGPARLGVNFD